MQQQLVVKVFGLRSTMLGAAWAPAFAETRAGLLRRFRVSAGEFVYADTNPTVRLLPTIRV